MARICWKWRQMTVIVRATAFAILAGLAGPAAAETLWDYDLLTADDDYRIIDKRILDDGSVVIVFSQKNKNHAGFICHFHRDAEKSYDDKCREIGD